jgi:transcriptional regulator with XRE-family HTH domain
VAGVGDKIRILRRKRLLLQRELTKKIGKSRGYISKVERGERVPSSKLIKKIAIALEVSPEELQEDRNFFVPYFHYAVEKKNGNGNPVVCFYEELYEKPIFISEKICDNGCALTMVAVIAEMIEKIPNRRPDLVGRATKITGGDVLRVWEFL